MAAEDDPEVLDDHTVVRAVAELHFGTDEDGQRRLLSTAFNPSTDGSGTSVVVAERMGADATGEARRPGAILAQFPAHELRCLTAGQTRDAGREEGHALGLLPDPQPEEPGHANITWPEELSRGQAHRVRKQLSRLAGPLPPEAL